MLKISRFADYAVVILSGLERSGQMASASGLSALVGLPEPSVSRILKSLTKDKILVSVRGNKGGYRLSRPPSEITIADIITAIDGPIALTACAEGAHDACLLSHQCSMTGRWTTVNQAVRSALEDVSLADMMKSEAAPGKTGMADSMIGGPL